MNNFPDGCTIDEGYQSAHSLRQVLEKARELDPSIERVQHVITCKLRHGIPVEVDEFWAMGSSKCADLSEKSWHDLFNQIELRKLGVQ